MNKSAIIDRIRETGIVPVIRADSVEIARQFIDAILGGGIAIFEIAMTVPNAPSLIRSLVDELGDRAVIGAGTVLDANSAGRCLDAGAKFIVSPILDISIIDLCRQDDTAVFPGALTPTEILHAWRSGADAVKIFPAASMGGPHYLRDIRTPLPEIELMPTGGVTLATIGEYIRAGAIAAGVGSELTDVRAIQDGNSEKITQASRAFLNEIQAARTPTI